MNQYQLQLFNSLQSLVKDSDVFYRQEFELNEHHYWIYNYRLASYSNFLLPGAIEARGIMFEVGFADDGEVLPRRLAAHPMEKFFNLNENPLTMNLDLTQIVEVDTKADGSLMSTYIHTWRDPGVLLNTTGVRLKSKGSLFSEQALHAMVWLDLPENNKFKSVLFRFAEEGYTVNLEWCAPQHRIVIGYQKPILSVLNVRSNIDGSYLPYALASQLHPYWVERFQVADPVAFVMTVPELTDIEGYIYRFADGMRVKHKTKWYLALHHSKDSVNSDRRLYEAVLSEATDDLRSMFYNDPYVIGRIDMMEKFVEEKYNKLVSSVTSFYQENKDLVRKDYAILGQKVLDRHQFGLAMRLFINQEVNFKDYMIAKWKEFGIKDDPAPSEDTPTIALDIESVPPPSIAFASGEK